MRAFSDLGLSSAPVAVMCPRQIRPLEDPLAWSVHHALDESGRGRDYFEGDFFFGVAGPHADASGAGFDDFGCDQ